MRRGRRQPDIVACGCVQPAQMRPRAAVFGPDQRNIGHAHCQTRYDRQRPALGELGEGQVIGQCEGALARVLQMLARPLASADL